MSPFLSQKQPNVLKNSDNEHIATALWGLFQVGKTELEQRSSNSNAYQNYLGIF